jgi:hypothetical protein
VIAFQATQVLEFLRTGCLKERDKPSHELTTPPPIILPYFGIVRIADKKLSPTGPILQQDAVLPHTLALKAPPHTPTVPQVQNDLSAMNMDGQNAFNAMAVQQQPPTFGDTAFNWDFDFAVDPVLGGNSEIGAIPMDIEAWSSVCKSFPDLWANE